MRSTALFIIVSLLVCVGCKSALFNYALEKKGIYNTSVEIKQLDYKDSSNILFIPMHHVGREEFYKDVKDKIDSLSALGYFFYYEEVQSGLDSTNSDLYNRKLRKVTGITTNSHMASLDSLGLKLKYKLIGQPSYKAFGVDKQNGRNVDLTIKGLIDLYELEFGTILLENCDYIADLDQETKCKERIDKTRSAKIILDYRNTFIVENIRNSSNKKLALIYGANHFVGIDSLLLNLN